MAQMAPGLPTTNKAIRLHPPSHDIRVEELPFPKITHPDDAIVKVLRAGLCGSDLHAYRGAEPFDAPYTCGHELVGEIVALGSSFGAASAKGRPLLYSSLKLGDKVVSPFTCSCEECHFCRMGFPSRCVHSLLFGSPYLEGAQAQYARIPKAGGTLFALPSNLPPGVSDESFMLCGDVLPTGYFAALQALGHPNLAPIMRGIPYPLVMGSLLPEVAGMAAMVPTAAADRHLNVAVIGLGPVGVCAVVSLLDILTQQKFTDYNVFAIDPVPARRAKMTAILAKAPKSEAEHVTVVSIDESKDAIKTTAEGKGFDAVLEVVGSNGAIELSYELMRPFGVIASVGVHTAPQFPLNGDMLYTKNVAAAFGRCPVRAIFPFAVDLLIRRQDMLGGVGGEEALIEKIVPLDNAREAYEKFDSREWGKCVFDPFFT